MSGFRIDLGVRHPDYAGAWLAGVECDGARYHSSATARDRDRIRQAVLEGLGWKILRIWSTDWFRAPEATLRRIDERLSEVLEADRAQRARVDVTGEVDEAPEDPLDDLMPELSPMTLVDDAAVSPVQTTAVPSMEPFRLFAQGPAQNTGETCGDGAGPAPKPDPDRFFDDDYTALLLAIMENIVASEGPIAEASLARKIAQIHGWQRTGARIQARIAALQAIFDSTVEEENRFIWIRGSVRDRVEFRGMKDRAPRDISRAEIAELIDRNLGSGPIDFAPAV